MRDIDFDRIDFRLRYKFFLIGKIEAKLSIALFIDYKKKTRQQLALISL